jgi:hypothetical protein
MQKGSKEGGHARHLSSTEKPHKIYDTAVYAAPRRRSRETLIRQSHNPVHPTRIKLDIPSNILKPESVNKLLAMVELVTNTALR